MVEKNVRNWEVILSSVFGRSFLGFHYVFSITLFCYCVSLKCLQQKIKQRMMESLFKNHALHYCDPGICYYVFIPKCKRVFKLSHWRGTVFALVRQTEESCTIFGRMLPSSGHIEKFTYMYSLYFLKIFVNLLYIKSIRFCSLTVNNFSFTFNYWRI